MSLNRVTIIGHLGQDPEIRHLASGQAVGRFSVATDEPYTDKEGNRQEHTEWHQVVVFGRVAETYEKYLARGRQVYVEGRLRTREYEAKNNGGKPLQEFHAAPLYGGDLLRADMAWAIVILYDCACHLRN